MDVGSGSSSNSGSSDSLHGLKFGQKMDFEAAATGGGGSGQQKGKQGGGGSKESESGRPPPAPAKKGWFQVVVSHLDVKLKGVK